MAYNFGVRQMVFSVLSVVTANLRILLGPRAIGEKGENDAKSQKRKGEKEEVQF